MGKTNVKYRLWCLTVAVAMVAVLMPLPAAADTSVNKWSKLTVPEVGVDGGWVLTGDLGAGDSGVTAIAVSYEGTIFAAVEAADDAQFGGYNLFRSTDGGYTWKPLWKIPAGDGSTRLISIVLPEPDDATNLYVATENRVYQSTDGGRRFHNLGSPAAGGAVITSLDVGERRGENVIFVGTRVAGAGVYGGAYVLDESRSSGWTDLRVGNEAAGTKYDVLAVALSPDFDNDRQYVAVITDEVNTVVTTRIGSTGWGVDVGDAVMLGIPATGASIAFPANYDSNVEEDLYIQYVGLDAGGVMGGIFIVMGIEAPDSSLAAPVFFGAAVHSIDAAGEAFPLDVDIGEGFDLTVASQAFTPAAVVAGLCNGGVVSIATGVAYTPPGAVTAANACVAIGEFYGSAYYVYAGTTGLGGGFARSIDNGANFARTGLMCDEIAAVTALAVSPVYDKDDTVYMITERDSGESLLWRTTDRGDTWDAVLTEGQLITSTKGASGITGNLKEVVLSPKFATDTTIFLVESGSRPDIWRSTDNGFRFWKLQTPATSGEIYSLAIVDQREIFAGSLDSVYYTKNDGRTWKKYDDGLTGPLSGDITQLLLSPDYDADETLLAIVGGKITRSTDAGQEWKEVKGFGEKGDNVTCVALHPDYADNGTIFAAGYDGSGHLLVFRLGGPDIDKDVTMEETYGQATGIGLGPDGTLYVAAEGVDGMFRMLMPMSDDTDDFEWQVMSQKFEADYLTTLTVTSGSNVVHGIAYDADSGEYQARRYEDTLTGKVTLTAPRDGSATEKLDRVTLSWEAMGGARRYEVEYDRHPGFNGAPRKYESGSTSLDVLGLDDGITYYWRVRVIENSEKEAMYSRWSDTWSFTTRLGAGEWNPFVGGVPEAPANGATNVPLQPTFAWNAADWATGYEFALAEDAAFTDVVISKTGGDALDTTVYQCETRLREATTYYWKVRGKSNTSASEWGTAVFTTIAAPGAAPTAPPMATPTPEPATPAYVWVTIGIGAALVIVLLVLIIRTRRVY